MTAASQKFEAHALTSSIGAEIRGVDLRQDLSDTAYTFIHQAWLDHKVLLFRNQTLSDPQMVAFSRRFGELDLAPIPGHGRTFVEGIPEMFVISNVEEDGHKIGSLGDGECLWHTDMAYAELPPKASCLYSLEVLSGEGDTGFLNMYEAYESLPKQLKDRIRGLTIKHDTQYTLDGLDRNEGKPLWEAKADGSFDVVTLPGTSHPIVRMHPETLRPALYLGRRQNTYINGLPLNDSEALLDALWAHTDTMGQSTFHHRWRVGDLLIWDNRCVMHRRDAFPPTSRRIMHRTQIRSDLAPAAA
ncbi:MAG: taurine catabolism dioxygenase TauD [Rhodospirillaceae bacterium]|nr:taurine catabolism dioxygenase TauD [Rhodospirillaceae bacterium]